MVNEQFNSIPELYKRVMPALKSKRKELEAKKLGFITEEDIWHCLRKKKWNKERELTLFDIVHDILYMTEEEILEYIKIHKERI